MQAQDNNVSAKYQMVALLANTVSVEQICFGSNIRSLYFWF